MTSTDVALGSTDGVGTTIEATRPHPSHPPRRPHTTNPQLTARPTDFASALADRLGLGHFGVGEHHSADFAVSSPAVMLAAIAARTERIRLTSSVTTLSVHDPVRVYQDFATVDLLSHGRAEITIGRSAYREPFELFGVELAHYDEIFDEKLDLLLRLRDHERVTWRGRFRPPMDDVAVPPRAVQSRLPVWVGVGGTPTSAVRAGRLGLPMILGYIGGPVERLAALSELYREAGRQAGHESSLNLGVALHYLGTDSAARATEAFPYYREFLRPKRPGGSGFVVDRGAYEAGLAPAGHLMIGTSEYVTDKLSLLVNRVAPDRIQALVDWGGLPMSAVRESVERLATEIGPALPATPVGEHAAV